MYQRSSDGTCATPPGTDVVDQLLSPAVLLRVFYLSASALVLIIQAIPALRARFLAYGSRATSPSSESSASKTSGPKPTTSVDQLLDYLASFQVPHNWFTYFYALSVACSLFWGWNQWTLSLRAASAHTAWVLMLIQGGRRLLESYAYTSNSKSKMWLGHHILGLLFYLTINVAIWIEDSLSFWYGIPQCSKSFRVPGTISWQLDVLPAVILGFHGMQHTYHAYLHRLRTENEGYQMPDHPLFPRLICPHYTCEVVIYLLLSFVAAPPTRTVNWTLASATVFVAVNLGVTAVGTENWYVGRFGSEKMKGKKKMVPWVW